MTPAEREALKREASEGRAFVPANHIAAKIGFVLNLDEAQQAWDWLATRTNLELDWGEIDEGEAAWRVHRISGNRNDREWELIATGDTPLQAVVAARAALNL